MADVEVARAGDVVFACDAMLGGLARWLRAAGYDASWHPGIADADLVALARAGGRVLLSRDAGLIALPAARAARAVRILADRPVDQLGETLRALALPLKPARCMACGGALVELPLEEARTRAPPGALRATDRFWSCARCGRTLWRGSHWRRITAALAAAGSAQPPSAG